MDIDEELIDIGDEEEEKQQEIIQLNQSPMTNEWNQEESVTKVDSDMDEESRKLIEQMLAEEEYYYGKDSISNMTTSKKRKGVKDSDYSFDLDRRSNSTGTIKKSKKEGVISSASLPSHKTRWNAEEGDRLREALVKFGYGNWKLISEYVKTRNPLQCKNHARHLTQTEKADINSITQNKQSQSESKPSSTVIEESQVKKPTPSTSVSNKIQMDENVILKPDAEEEEEDTQEDELSIDGSDNIKYINSTQSMPSSVPLQPTTPNIDRKEEETLLAKQKDIPVITTTNNEIIPDSTIQSERDHGTLSKFDPFQVSDEEMAENPEWFRQKYSKTPDRYLKIRNHMLHCWNQCKPKYLTKTSARKGLKDCGDVNAIGRVHHYLEAIGAINVDCITNASRPPKRVPRELYEQDEPEGFDASEYVVGYDGPRKRKVRNEKGEWVDPKELEGRVIEHGQVIVQLDSKPKRVIKKSNQYYGGDDFGRGYDPFRLIPTNHYNDDLPAPFEVEIISDALLVIDFHSHLAHTEIIGLLGGNFITRGESKVLQVQSVFPCQSTSTGIQCEMDPASEIKAREVFADKGFNVVGWYHSHPTFEPHPSIRDIENQTSYQTLFRKENTGDEPFIGVIVTPYDPEILSDHSQIQYLHISKEWDDLRSYRVPYACRRTVIQSEQVLPEIFNQLVELIGEYKDYEHKVKMLLPFGTQTRLQKLLDSLRAHLFTNQQDEETFINAVKDMVSKEFVDDQPFADQISTHLNTTSNSDPANSVDHDTADLSTKDVIFPSINE